MSRIPVLFMLGGFVAGGLLTAAQPGAKGRPTGRSPRQVQTGPKAASRGAKPVQPGKPAGAQQAGQKTGVWDDTDIAHVVKEGVPAKPAKPSELPPQGAGPKQTSPPAGLSDDTVGAGVSTSGAKLKKAPKKPGGK